MASHTDLKACNWCKSEIKKDATRCPTCQTWQGQLGPYGPRTLVVASIVTAFLTPCALGLATLWYQNTSRAQDATRARLDHTFTEVKTVVDKLGEWQTNYDALLMDCEPDHADSNDKCLSDYTRRLVKMDDYISQLSWEVSASPVGDFPHARMGALKNEWWNVTRHALDNTLGRFAVRPGTSAVLTDASTSDDDYNKLVNRCEEKWDDPSCPSLKQCQQHGFEHSECVKELVDKLRKLDDVSMAAFCAVVVSLDVTRIKDLKELNASDRALEDLQKQLCADTCYKSVQAQYPEAASLCAGSADHH